MVERLSTRNNTLISSYAEHILRYQFALPYCTGKRVLDAGCGIGYGSAFLARNGAREVLAIDISDDALSEATDLFKVENLHFKQHDVECIDSQLGQFDVVVNFENIEHIPHPDALVSAASRLLPSGTFITSTPNGAVSIFKPDGKLANEFHVREFTIQELSILLSPHFKKVAYYGQWLSHGGQLRKLRARQMFDYFTESYYNPASRVGRWIKSTLGRKSMPPPEFFGAADSFEGDCVIYPIEHTEFPWPPDVILAVCTN